MATSNYKEKKVAVLGRDAKIVDGIQKDLKGVSSLQLAGSTYTPADLVTLIESRASQVAAVTTANATWHAAVAAEKELNTKLAAVITGLRQYVLNAFGATSPVLADFGFTATVRKPLTPEQNVAKAAKAKATREARHTMGKVQKKKVTGTAVAAASAAPAPAPAASTAPAPAPAQPAPKAS
ncbi:MAG: hypothetical protein ACRENE_03045 [Polyangiaceae bacterium]